MALAPGTRLGPYEVTAQIGVGGMGEVYRATDTNLKRDVAIKVLPEALASDPDRLARFQREAEVLARLNHPNIAHIHGLEKTGGALALVMELVEGPTLAEMIAGSRLQASDSGAAGTPEAQSPKPKARGLPLSDALNISRQLAEALEAAHEQGIIHRDLKPANIKVRPDGTVKVLDFGLAKAMGPTSDSGLQAPGSASMSPTLTSPAFTQAGVILGTAAYMSPEQAKGRPVDKRSDIWAFGCVLYEMLTGRRAFDGEDVTDTIVAVMSKEPDWRALPSALSATHVAFLKQCLEKSLKQRLPDIGAMRLAIEGAFETASPGAASVPPVRPLWRVVLPWAAGIGLAVVAGVAVWVITRPAPTPPAPVRRFQETLPEGLTLSPGSGSLVALSPDGQTLVYRAFAQGPPQLYRRRLDAVSAEAVAGTEGASGLPFFSPDGQWLGFRVGPMLMKVPLVGGRPEPVGKVPNFSGASWEPDGSIILGAMGAGLVRIPAAGGQAVPLTKPTGGRWDLYPQILPGSRTVLFTSSIQAPNAGDLKGLDLATGAEQTLLRNAVAGRYLPGGDLVFVRGGDLWAVQFDPTRLRVQGEPVRVESGIRVEGGGSVQIAVAADGTLAYIPAAGSIGIGRTLVWVTRDGHEESVAAPARAYVSPRLSPDGTRVAMTIREQDYDIWIWDLRRDTLTRLTVDAAPDESPVWTPDGERVVFASTRQGPMNIFARAADGTGMVERLTDSPNTQLPSAFSPDGRVLVLGEAQPNTGFDLRVFAAAGDRRVTDLVATPFTESSAALSPDGRWVAYQANPSGRTEIYVRPFPDVNQGQWQVSTDGGTQPLWSRDGRELFYRNGDALMAVPIGRDPRTAGRPRQLFTGDYVQGDGGRAYDVAPDGTRFLMLKEPVTQNPTRATITIVEHWRTQLERLLPTK